MNQFPSCSSFKQQHLLVKQSTLLLFTLLLAIVVSGCQPVLLLGRILYGDPKEPSAFTLGTGTDLEKGEQRILVIASSKSSAHDGGTAVNIDVLDGLTRQLKRKGIKVVNPGEVATWIDDNGGILDDPADLLDEFETDYIVHIEIEKFSLNEDHSPSLLRARFSGTVTAYKVLKKGEGHRVKDVWQAEFSKTHPSNYPISSEKISKELFQQQAINRLTAQLSQFFYAQTASETFE